jgi:hypothetical protein
MPPKKTSCVFGSETPKPPKAPQAWKSYSQSFQATQHTHDSLSVVVIQPPEALVASVAMQRAVVLIEDIKEDELGADVKAHSETAKDKADEVDKIKLLELLAEEVIRMGLPAVPTLWEPITAVPILDLKVINLLDKLIFTAWRAGELIYGSNAGVKSNSLSN